MKRKPQSKRKLAPRKEASECLCCGSASPWVVVSMPQETSYRGQAHQVVAEVTQCRHCDAIVTSPEQNTALLERSELAHRAWVKGTLKVARKRFNLPQREFAAALGISTATLSRALKGKTLIDPSTEALLLIKIKELKAAQEKQFLLNLTLSESSVSSGVQGPPLSPTDIDGFDLPLAA